MGAHFPVRFEQVNRDAGPPRRRLGGQPVALEQNRPATRTNNSWALLGSNQRPLPCKHRAGTKSTTARPARTGRNRCGCWRFTSWCLLLVPSVVHRLVGQPWDGSARREGRPERSDPLTVGRPPGSWTAAPPLVGGRTRGARGAGALRCQGRAGDRATGAGASNIGAGAKCKDKFR
jgi:hypothetical protein